MCNIQGFMTDLMTRLDRLYSGLNQLEASAQLARAEAQDAYQARMAELRQKRGAAEIHKLQDVGEHAGEQLKHGACHAPLMTALGTRCRYGIPRIIRPRMFRITALELLLHFGVGPLPEALEVLRHLDRPARR